MQSGHGLFPPKKVIKYDLANPYDSLMQFIRHNKTIPEKLASFTNSQADLDNIETLANAIKTGDLTHTIFSHPFCELYVIYLITEKAGAKKISCNDFLTVYVYLMALMQFTYQQTMRAESASTKVIKKIKIKTLDDDNLAKAFYDHHRHARAGTVFHTNKFEVFQPRIKQLSPLNKLVLAIPTSSLKENDPEDFLRDTAKHSSVVLSDSEYYYFSSVEYHLLVLKEINESLAVKPVPVFGRVGFKSLHDLHQLGFHPVNLYSNFVKSNPINIHGVNPGPFAGAHHDLSVHVDWGNHIAENHYRFLFQYFLPLYEKLFNVAIDSADSEYTVKHIRKIYDLRLYSKKKGAQLDNFYSCLSFAAIDLNEIDIVKLFAQVYLDRGMITTQYNINIDSLLHSSSLLNYKGFTKNSLSFSTTSFTPLDVDAFQLALLSKTTVDDIVAEYKKVSAPELKP